MDMDEFSSLFEECVEVPLRQQGFERYKKTKSLILTKGDVQLSLIRLGGRRAQAGCITQTLCFRHTFLRPINSDSPVAFTLEPHDYPFKLTLQAFAEPRPEQLLYRPMNLGRWPKDRYCFEAEDPKNVQRDLNGLKDLLVKEVVPWSSRMTPEVVAAQIKKLGEGAWCERRWLADYQAYRTGDKR